MAQGTQKSSQILSAFKTPSKKKPSPVEGQPSTQRKILSFFPKSPAEISLASAKGASKTEEIPNTSNGTPISIVPSIKTTSKKPDLQKPISILSSDVSHLPSSVRQPVDDNSALVENGFECESRSSLTPEKNVKPKLVAISRNPCKAKKSFGNDESKSDTEEDIFDPTTKRSRRVKKIENTSDDLDLVDEIASASDSNADDDYEDVGEYDDSNDFNKNFSSPKKRKRCSISAISRKRNTRAPDSDNNCDPENEEIDVSNSSSVHKWKYDPENPKCLNIKPPKSSRASKSHSKPLKEKAHKTDPDKRYPWLAQIRDMDENPVGHPDYDSKTIYIPPYAWDKFSAFEHQYWSIKQKFWDTVVFFKKGKFYELYETDATIGHQLFDLKLTDRVNMRMVGVPESSLDHWASQFVAKGYKIARVDQCESALGKEMREAEGGTKSLKPTDKIIKRELTCVLTGGTLVEESMLQDDMATFCIAIKESTVNELPAFGIAIVDTATGQFFISEFIDDDDLTRFETLVAQTRPQELLLEKSNISSKALRILKNNTNPTTIWNYLKPGSEFWTAEATCRELDCSGYFMNENGNEIWPVKLREVRDQKLVMSAVGALVQYLRSLKLERNLLTQKNFVFYDPIQKGTSLVLDGKTLINLEIFANTFDGTQKGTLFNLMNRCVTPFGKRLFKQWVCHPLANVSKINERLDAVDMINKDRVLSDSFTECMSGLPDLERLISRIHAGACRPEDFIKVLTAFGQIKYTMSLLEHYKCGESYISKLILSMPDIKGKLDWWKTAFDYSKAKENKMLIPALGVEPDFDESQECISVIERELESVLVEKRRELGTSQINYKNVGKEIYQLEVPSSIKVPKDWQMTSSAAKFKRYYFSELKQLVRRLQEAQETHGQIVKQVALKFYARFDLDYTLWQQVIGVVAQLDCLISLAVASVALGEPSCRPKFVEKEDSFLKLEELRHPCMVSYVNDYIPNDIKLGGDVAKITLLTGANAAGKSTILRMTCIAVIMAQIGCYVPAISATLTPVDRIMSRLGANDNIFAAQSTFFVELYETKKILSEATPRSLVILDELGRGTSSYDGVAVAQSVLHHVATHIGCIGFFATHYHSLAVEFTGHPEITPKRMQIYVDKLNRSITFLYKLEDGIAESSFGMHCAAMCGIPSLIIDRAEEAAKKWEHTSRLKESLENAKSCCYLPLGLRSDVSWALKNVSNTTTISDRGLQVLLRTIDGL